MIRLTFFLVSAVLLQMQAEFVSSEDDYVRLDSNGVPYQHHEKVSKFWHPQSYHLWWSAYGMEKNDLVEFYSEVENEGFVGLGLSPRDSMEGADLAVMWRDIKDDSPRIVDFHAYANGPPVKDEQQNWEILEVGVLESPKRQFFRFRRPIDTLDSENDRKITRDKTWLIYSFSPHRPTSEEDIVYHLYRGQKELRLLVHY